MKTTPKKRKTIPAFFIFITIVFVVFAFVSSLGTPEYLYIADVPSQQGIVDLTGFTFSATTAQTRNFEHFPRELLSPAEIEGRQGAPTDDDQNYGTYRIRFLLPDNEVYALGFSSIDYATKVFINGKEVGSAGTVGTEKAATVPQTTYFRFSVQPVEQTIEVVLQYSNFQGGLGHAILLNIGSPALMSSRQTRTDFYSFVLMGAFLAAFLLHLGLFLFHPKLRGNLYFALLCLLLALREGLTGEQAFGTMLPHVSWQIGYRLQYLSVCLLAVLVLALVDEIFPKILHRPVKLAAYGVTAVYALLVVCTDTQVFSRWMGVYQLTLVPVLLYLAVRIALRLKTFTLDQTISVAGVGVFVFGLVWDMLYYHDIFFIPMGARAIGNITLIIFLFVQMMALFLQFTRIEGDLLEARAKEATLELQNEMLRVLDRQRLQFFSNISHEMKTPLTVMSGYAQLSGRKIERGMAEEAPPYLAKITAEADRLALLVNQLLHLARLQESKTQLRPIKLNEVIQGTADTYRPLLETSGNRLCLNIANKLPPVLGDAALLQQVLLNLLANANRYTENGEITVSAEQTPNNTGTVAVTVADTGCGIAPAQLAGLFTRFSGQNEADPTSTGLGLAICKEIVEAHGGTVGIESEVDKGTEVWFAIPTVPNGELRVENGE